MKLTIYTDGGSRGNPGPAAYGFVVYENEKIIFKKGEYLGIQTNNYAEYMAVIAAFEWVKKHKGEDVSLNLFCDSLLVASQLTGKYKVKNESIKQLVKKAKALESFFSDVTYTHVLRAHNKEADRMVNKALDEKL